MKKKRVEKKDVKEKIVEKPDPIKAFIVQFNSFQYHESELRAFIRENYIEKSVDTDRVLRERINIKSIILGDIGHFIQKKKERVKNKSVIKAFSDIESKLNEIWEELNWQMDFLGYHWSPI